MQIKTNIRAGAGSANTGGQNSKKGLSTNSSSVVPTPPPPPPVYYTPVGRCVGY